MSYAGRSDVEDIFGVNNVKKWADIDGDGVAATITARITRALEFANGHIDDRLRSGPYAVPFSTPYPVSLIDAAAKIAGVWLYEGRGITDFDSETGRSQHRLHWHKRSVDKWLHDLKLGKVTLDVDKSESTPEVVTHVLET